MSPKHFIYFCGSIRAGRQDVDLYKRIIDKLEQFGEVVTPFVGDKTITVKGSEHTGGDIGIHDRDVELLLKSNCKYFYLTQRAGKRDHLRDMKIANFQNLFRGSWGC